MKLAYFWSKFFLTLHGKAIRGSIIDKKAHVNYGCNIVNVNMGRYSYCGYDCWIIDAEIGSFCSISNYVHIGGPSHPVEYVSTSPVFHQSRNMFGKHFSEHEFNPYKHTVIDNDVWIGENAIIKAGVHIGNGAVVGMGSVVTKNIPPYEIWAGNPAKMISKRFDDDTIRKLLETQWWNLNDEHLKDVAVYFSNAQAFLTNRDDHNEDSTY